MTVDRRPFFGFPTARYVLIISELSPGRDKKEVLKEHLTVVSLPLPKTPVDDALYPPTTTASDTHFAFSYPFASTGSGKGVS